MQTFYLDIARHRDLPLKKLVILLKNLYKDTDFSEEQISQIQQSNEYQNHLFILSVFSQNCKLIFKILTKNKVLYKEFSQIQSQVKDFDESIIKQTQQALLELPQSQQQEYITLFEGIIKFDDGFLSISEKIGQSSNIFFNQDNEIDTSQIPNEMNQTVDGIRSKLSIINEQLNYDFICQNIIAVYPKQQCILEFHLQLKTGQSIILSANQISKHQELSKIVICLLGSQFFYTKNIDTK
ncbi:hypothetical protein SS50377_21129 [Spironucleus salmonicida]|uniref:Uncharacterized protein n=1 Tax=Spironucleus salmonicida TaxID=348837 RepID=V6LJL9_9EUKA|nr:hypothetical protein SS50377_21129 [Spironucleus salmonicida]|eukprot:EST43911.1 Hypothetical protein SS50377_16211 [Spironucleus salmonicida]